MIEKVFVEEKCEKIKEEECGDQEALVIRVEGRKKIVRNLIEKCEKFKERFKLMEESQRIYAENEFLAYADIVNVGSRKIFAGCL